MIGQIFSLFILPFIATAQGGFQFKPLAGADSMKTYFHIPFAVTGPDLPSTSSSYQVRILDDVNEACRAKASEKSVAHFILRCKLPATIRIQVDVKSSGQLYRMTYGPVAIADMTNRTIVEPVSEQLLRQVQMGQGLFGAYCIECHSSALELKNKTAADIRESRETEPDMMSSAAIQQLTTDQLEVIATYLRNLHLVTP